MNKNHRACRGCGYSLREYAPQERYCGACHDERLALRPTRLAPDRAKRVAKSKTSASKRSKSGAAGKA